MIAAYLLANQVGLLASVPSYALIAIYMVVMAAISLVAVLPLKDYTGKPLMK